MSCRTHFEEVGNVVDMQVEVSTANHIFDSLKELIKDKNVILSCFFSTWLINAHSWDPTNGEFFMDVSTKFGKRRSFRYIYTYFRQRIAHKMGPANRFAIRIFLTYIPKAPTFTELCGEVHKSNRIFQLHN